MLSTRQLLKGTAIYSFLGFLPAASRLVIFPILVQRMDISEFGLVSLNWSVVIFFLFVLPLGIDLAFSRIFYDYQNNIKLTQKLISSTISMILILSLVWMLILYATGPWLFRQIFKEEAFSFWPYGNIALLTSISSIAMNVVMLYFRNSLQPVPYLWISLLTIGLSILFELIVVFFITSSAEGVLWARCLSVFLVGLCVVVYVYTKFGIHLSLKLFNNSFVYAGTGALYAILSYFTGIYDRILVANHLGLTSVAIFSLAFTIAQTLELISNAVAAALNPSIYSQLSNDTFDTIRTSQMVRIVGLCILYLSACILALAPFFIEAFTPEAYKPAIPLICLLLAGFSLRFYYSVYSLPLFYLKKHVSNTLLLVLIGGVVLIGLNLLLLPLYGLLGAAIAMIGARVSTMALTWVYYHKIGVKNKIIFNLKYVLLLSSIFFIYLICIPLLESFFVNKYYFFYLVPLIVSTIGIIVYLVHFWPGWSNWRLLANRL
jgi:O-antigen/teichoic acid export membrane protein